MSDRQYKHVLGALTFSGICPTPPDKWMIMLDMSFLNAQRYKNVVVILSIKKGGSKTFFPLCGAPSHRDQMMCMTHVNDNHIMIIYLKVDYKNLSDRYTNRMVDYNKLCRAAGYDVVRDDQDLYIVENFDPRKKVVAEKKVKDGVKTENDESCNIGCKR